MKVTKIDAPNYRHWFVIQTTLTWTASNVRSKVRKNRDLFIFANDSPSRLASNLVEGFEKKYVTNL